MKPKREVETMDEEVVLLEEQLVAAQGDIERLQGLLAAAEARESTRMAEVTELQRRIAGHEEARAAQTVELEDLRAAVGESEAQAREAVERIRQAVLEREPELPRDLLTGDSVADLDAAVAHARQTVAQVRQHLEQQAQSQRVPAGAPARGGPDVSAMTAGEKIRSGLRQA
jgi:ABC-type molybdate transport system ATPase subunit